MPLHISTNPMSFLPTTWHCCGTDASDYALGCIWLQLHGKRLHPVAFHCRTLTPAEHNYNIHDKESLATLVAFMEWKHYFEGTEKPITVNTDHQNEQYFLITKAWTPSQIRLEFVTGQTGPRKTLAPSPFPRPAPLNGLGRGVFFGIPCPSRGSGPRPTHTLDGSPLKMGGNKRGPCREWVRLGPGRGRGGDYCRNTPPGPV